VAGRIIHGGSGLLFSNATCSPHISGISGVAQSMTAQGNDRIINFITHHEFVIPVVRTKEGDGVEYHWLAFNRDHINANV